MDLGRAHQWNMRERGDVPQHIKPIVRFVIQAPNLVDVLIDILGAKFLLCHRCLNFSLQVKELSTAL